MRLLACGLVLAAAGGFSIGSHPSTAAEGASGPPAWPVSRDGLLFAFETNYFKNPTYALDADGKPILMYSLLARDRAHYDRNYAMVLTGGSFVGERIGPYLAVQWQKSGALTLEALVAPQGLAQAEPGVLMMFGSDAGVQNFSLMQVKNQLLLSLLAGAAKEPAAKPVELCTLEDTKPFHLVVTYADGNLVCYRDGKEVSRKKDVTGNFSHWDTTHLLMLFGDDGERKHNGSGTLEGITFYSRALGADEVAAEYKAYAAKIQPRKPPTVIRLKATLLAKSSPRELSELGTYVRATVLYEYQVKEVLAGEYTEKNIRVIHWAIMDRKYLPAMVERAVGQDYTLVVEPFSENPQMEGEMLRDDLPDSDLPMYYDVTP